MKNFLLSILIIIFTTGCLTFNSRSARPVAAALKKQYPDIRLEEEFSITAGAWIMGMVSMLAFDESDIDLSRIKRAEVGIYNISNLDSLKNFNFPAGLMKNRDCPELETVVKIRGEDEFTNVMICIKHDRITSIFIVAIETRELVVVNAVGNYNAIIQAVLKSVDRKKRYQQASDEREI